MPPAQRKPEPVSLLRFFEKQDGPGPKFDFTQSFNFLTQPHYSCTLLPNRREFVVVYRNRNVEELERFPMASVASYRLVSDERHEVDEQAS